MFMMMSMSILIILIASMMIMVSTLLSKKLNNREKSSPFECGFDPKKSTRMPFSLRFFLFTIMFLIFDVEIVLLMPMIQTYHNSSPTQWTLTTNLFVLILIIGLAHEWNQGSLEWAK